MIKKHKEHFRLCMMCRVLSVSRSGYYDWEKRVPSLRYQENKFLSDAIKTIYHDEKQRVGSPRITARLKASGRIVGKNRVARIMRKLGLRAKGSKKFKATTNSRHKLPVAENWLNQDFSASKENQKWASDITYIWTSEGWLYLAVVLDLYSRRVVGWAMSEQHVFEYIEIYYNRSKSGVF